MGSIKLGSDITGDTSSSSKFTEGSGRCSNGTNLSRSSRDAVLALPRHLLANSIPLGHA